MKHLLCRLPSVLSSNALARTRLRRPLAGAAVCALSLSLVGCDLFEMEGEDYESDYDSDGATYTSYTPPPSQSAATKGATPGASTAGSSTAPTRAAANGAPARPAGSATNQTSSAVCGSTCPNEPSVKAETKRCAGSPSQGPCYCAAALTYFCFAMNECYAEAGAATQVTEAQLNDGFDQQIRRTAELDYACKYTGDGFSIDLTEIVVPGYDDDTAVTFGGGQQPASTPPPAGAQTPSGRSGCNPCTEEDCELAPGQSCVAFAAR